MAPNLSGVAAVLRLIRHPGVRRFGLFLMVGSLNFIFYYSFFTFLHFMETEPTQAVVIATIVAVLFNFGTTGRVVFKSGNIRRLPRFIAVYAIQMGLNIVSLRALISAGVPVLIAEAIVIGILAVLTFFALRYLVFGDAAGRRLRHKHMVGASAVDTHTDSKGGAVLQPGNVTRWPSPNRSSS